MVTAVERMVDQAVVPVIRARSPKPALDICRALIRGGMQVLELTTTIPEVLGVCGELRQQYDHLVIGMGTVSNERWAVLAAEHHVDILITYKVDESVARVGQAYGIPYILGGATPTEIDRCAALGSPVIKIFPARHLGTNFLRDMHGPIPELRFFPTGGIRIDDMSAWFQAGASVLGIGGDLVSLDSDGQNSLEKRAKRALAEAKRLSQARPAGTRGGDEDGYE
jgi:2-dehydro-3-deoxyphosphogluconate aldolase/(4S)-4-hydroxy-2-oxoglutarate aldolase